MPGGATMCARASAIQQRGFIQANRAVRTSLWLKGGADSAAPGFRLRSQMLCDAKWPSAKLES